MYSNLKIPDYRQFLEIINLHWPPNDNNCLNQDFYQLSRNFKSIRKIKSDKREIEK